MLEKILVAIDNSKSSRLILDRAIMIAQAFQARLNIVNVIVPFEDFYPQDSFIGISAPLLTTNICQLQELECAGSKMLCTLANEAITAGVVAEFTQQIGDPGQSICEVANNWDADLIILGRRGLKGFHELLIGSTSNYVLHHAPCNVLTTQFSERDLANLESEKTERMQCELAHNY